MSKEMEFAVFCIESYKRYKSLTGKQVSDLFQKYKVLDYLREFYDVLHTTGYQSGYRYLFESKRCSHPCLMVSADITFNVISADFSILVSIPVPAFSRLSSSAVFYPFCQVCSCSHPPANL